MHTGRGYNYQRGGSSFASPNKRGGGRGYVQNYSQNYGQNYGQSQRGGATGQWGRGRGSFGRGKKMQNSYPGQVSETLLKVIRWQRRRGITPGSGLADDNVEELRRQFPVSSGSEHRAQEDSGPALPPHLALKRLHEQELNSASSPVRYPPTTSAPRFGMKMLTKFGWSPGNGLGRNEDGTVEPVIPDGFYVQEYQPKKEPTKVLEDMSAKHPVMALTELCTRHKWPAPKFEVVNFSGPDHHKNYLMKVIVNGQAYQPPEATSSKKVAKAEAAAFFLESMGLYDRKKAPSWQ